MAALLGAAIGFERESRVRRVELQVLMPRGTPVSALADSIRQRPEVRHVSAATADRD